MPVKMPASEVTERGRTHAEEHPLLLARGPRHARPHVLLRHGPGAAVPAPGPRLGDDPYQLLPTGAWLRLAHRRLLRARCGDPLRRPGLPSHVRAAGAKPARPGALR